jgi:hypothetical protein
MPKKSVQESRDLVADARARINAEKEAARELAAAEAVVAQAEAEEAAKARAKHLDGLLSDFNVKAAEYEEIRDQALADAVRYFRSAQAASAAQLAVEAARGSLRMSIAPQGYGGDPAELEKYDVVSPHHALAVLHAGVASDPFQAEHDVNSLELDQLRGIVSSLPY